MDQSLEVFGIVFIHFTFLESKNVKINLFGGKIFLGAFLSNRSACVNELVQVI